MKKKYGIIAGMAILLICSRYGYCAGIGPEQTVREFYQWYLKGITNVNAIYQDEILDYVSRCTVEKCRANRARGITGSDYFTASQDPVPEWAESMVVHEIVRMDDFVSLVPVSFDRSAKNAPRLAVFLRKEGESYRIIKVENFDGYY